MADGADLVWEHLSEFWSSKEFPPGVRADSHDLLCCTIEYVALD